METVTLRIPEDVLDRAQAVGDACGMTAQAVLEGALAEFGDYLAIDLFAIGQLRSGV